jgi:predicted amidohydrolase
MNDSLKIALIHFAPEHRKPEENIRTLLRLNEEAALAGARVIVNTELATTGYTFKSRGEVAPFVEKIPGPTTEAFAEAAARHGVYIALGLPEVVPRTGIYYNSAVLLDPDGKTALRYRKINTEIRWACPGAVKQKNVVTTPWGRIGLLICSDAYHSLIPRVTAVSGADLVLVPANWPTTGLDPRRIWRARARENRMFLAICNRGGKEAQLDARLSHSGVYAPSGEILKEETDPGTRIFMGSLPLIKGKIRPRGSSPLKKMRRPELYHYIYLDLRSVRDLTSFYELPQPGRMTVGAVPMSRCKTAGETFEVLERKLSALPPETEAAVLPCPLFRAETDSEADSGRDRTVEMARRFNLTLVWGADMAGDGNRERMLLVARPDGSSRQRRDTHGPPAPSRPDDGEFPSLENIGTARTGVASVDEALQPEVSCVFSKLGSDLLLACGNQLDESDFQVLCTRAFDFSHVAAAGENWAMLGLPPFGHETWRVQFERDDPAVAVIDTSEVRVKRFQDRLDVEKLLKP